MVRFSLSLQWRHNERDGVSNNQPHDCLLNCLFRRRSKKTSKLCVTGLCEGIHWWPVNSPHKGPVTRKIFPFDDVIIVMKWSLVCFQVNQYDASATTANTTPRHLCEACGYQWKPLGIRILLQLPSLPHGETLKSYLEGYRRWYRPWKSD